MRSGLLIFKPGTTRGMSIGDVKQWDSGLMNPPTASDVLSSSGRGPSPLWCLNDRFCLDLLRVAEPGPHQHGDRPGTFIMHQVSGIGEDIGLDVVGG